MSMDETAPEKARQDVLKKTMGKGSNASLSVLISELMKTREIRTTISSAVIELLHIWAGNSLAKKTLSGAIGRNIQKSLSRPEDVFVEDELSGIFQKPDHVATLSNQLPKILDTLFHMAVAAGVSLENLPPPDRTKLLADIFSAIAGGRSGKLLTTWARVLANVHADDPDFLVKTLKPGIAKWIEHTDFGELKELLNGFSESAGPVTKMINDVIWEYPAKIVLLISFLPAVFNIIIKIANECVGRFNTLAPDLVADVILSCLRDIEAENIARTINEIAELIRKIDTGSALIGDAGVSGFNRELSGFLKKLISSIDVEKLIRAREGIASGKETASAAFMDALKEHPEMVLETIRRSQVLVNPAIKSLGMKVNLANELPEEEAAEAFSQTISKLNFIEIAEIINLSSLLFNRLRNLRPSLFSSAASQIVDSLDPDVLKDAITGLLDDIGEIVRPVGKAVLPHVITSVCRWLTPDDDHDEEALKEARDSMVSFLRLKEFQP